MSEKVGNPEIKNRFTGEVIIPAGKYASVREACEKEYKNLYGANLSRANLSGANLSRANLYGANLSEANLSRANLSGANLSRANLSEANLSEANLSGANLSEANLYGEKITKIPIQISGLRWWINITEKHIQIGCQVYKAEEWWRFSDKEIAAMHGDALTFWKANKKIIKAVWLHHVGGLNE